MQSKTAARLALVVFLDVVSFVQPLVAQTEPPIDPAYHKYLLHYVDERSLPEKLLNSVKLTKEDVGRSFAMIVGVARYPQLSDANHTLEPADRDIDLLFDYLKNQQFFDEIVVLRDDAVTFENLRYFLETYFPDRMRSSPHSRFIFAYSGHGMTKGKHGFLLTSAARNLSDKQNSIDMEVLRTFSQQTIEAGYQSLFLINACHSGAFTGRQVEGTWDYILKRPGAHAISSAGAKDSSWGENDKGSYFYQKLIQGLNGDADPGGSGIITVGDLGRYLQREVGLATSGHQVPTLPQDIWTGVSDGGVFFFNRAKAVRIADLPVWNPSRVIAYGPDAPITSNATRKTQDDAKRGQESVSTAERTIPPAANPKLAPPPAQPLKTLDNKTELSGVSTTVEGTIKDNDQRVVVGANITLLNETTGWSKDSKSDEVGRYRFVDVPPGTYSVVVKMPGFKDVVTSINVSPKNAQLALVPVPTKVLGWSVGNRTILRTTDGGASWTKQGIDGDLEAVTFITPQLGWAVGAEGLIIHTRDGGSTWKPQDSGLSRNQRLMSVCFVSPLSGWAVSLDGIILHTDDGGDTWKAKDIKGSLAPGNSLEFVTFPTPQSGWIVTNYGFLLHTDDGGIHWVRRDVGKNVGIHTIFFITPERGWAAGRDDAVRVIFHTDDGGVTWKRQWRDPLGKRKWPLGPPDFYSIAFTTEHVGWVVGDLSLMLHTADGGATWTPVTPAPFRLNSITFATPQIGWAVGDGVVMYTNDGGINWKQQIIEPGLGMQSTASYATH
jgi:photosystem II stability/assembly factor-like uncharacterized protein